MMERLVNRGTHTALTACAGLLVLGICSALWYFESAAPGMMFSLLCCGTLLLLVWSAWRQYVNSLTKLRLLEGKSYRLQCDHRQLQHQFRQQADELLTSYRNYQELVESANSIIIRWNRQGTIRYANPYALNFFGYQQDDFIGQGLLDTIVPPTESTGRDLTLMIDDISQNPQHYVSNENENICKDRRRVWVSWTNKVIHDHDGNAIEVLSVGNDITEKKRYERKIHQLAHNDQLTQLPNRHHLTQRLTQTITTAHRNTEYFTLLYIGLDRFKPINDSLGRTKGDLLLQILSTRMQRGLTAVATIARMGGDQFCAVLQNQHTEQEALLNAQAIASKLLLQINEPIALGQDTVYLTASIGISAFPCAGQCPDTLINHAETAMYRAKARSGNDIQLFQPSMVKRALRRLKLENALRAAMDNEQLVLHYQPALNMHSGRIDYMEALLRWHDAELGSVEPTEFVAVAEESGLMPQLSRWVLHQATQQAATWHQRGYHHMLMAVNLSPTQFESDSLLDDIRQALAASGLPPKCLGLEITESTIMYDSERGEHLLAQINEMGITLLIDDFGTGHSSLARLRELPVHTVKIDQSFIRDIGRQQNPSDGNMIDAIIAMAHGLGLQVIAEGVETQQQQHYLTAQSCDRLQGYWLSKALPAEQLEALLFRAERTAFTNSGTAIASG